MPFDYSLDFKKVDFRQRPELYRVGKGEQGVLLVEPYKSEILPHWRFRTPEIAQESSERIYELFQGYLKSNDFVGADMARKFLQMALPGPVAMPIIRREKYDGRCLMIRKVRAVPTAAPSCLAPRRPEKAAAAAIFKQKWIRPNTTPNTNGSAPNFRLATASEPQIPTFI
ncbi:DUF4385 family protein [Hymenobacter radiodurans]|uniref:DUF4385 family protein n=1 Tax=Hymenobacter radiodurans TaxID=2496028 RepID=UPI001058B2D6|nr:DUF4385 family protein [Hymenobacter radiodurans]